MEKFLIVGLGNIGPEYFDTRHNIGFDVIDAFVEQHQSSFIIERLAAVAKFKWKGKSIICIKPSTYMNLSGKAVKYWMDKENMPLQNTLIIVDELALPLSKIRIKPGGTDGGHNGLKSIQESLGTNQYTRLRFGIGNNYPKGMQVQYVLGKWWSDQLPLVRIKIPKCIEAIESFITVGVEKTMNIYNKLEVSL